MRTRYLTNLGGMRFGIWKDEVRSVRDAQPVHRLPRSPACVACISVLDGRSTALADLAVCVGLRPPDQGGKGLVLFVAGKDADSAFIVPGPLAEAEVPSDARSSTSRRPPSARGSMQRMWGRSSGRTARSRPRTKACLFTIS